MEHENIEPIVEDVLPDDYDLSSAVLLDGDSDELSSTSTDTESGDELSNESEISESVSMGDSTTFVSTYTEAEQQADSELIGSVTALNGTCILILFFLLFSWVDKKIQAIVNGVSGK